MSQCSEEKIDLAKIDPNNRADLDYWTERFGVSQARLRTAVEAVGQSVSDIEAWRPGEVR